MAFSQNPFSVASFGESYEQADLTVVLTGVQGTTGINGDGFDVRSIVSVFVEGLQANGSIDDVTVEAKAVFTLDSVSATGTIDSPTIVEGTGVVFTTASVTATGSVNDDLNIVAKAVVIPESVESTGTIDEPTIIAKAVVVPSSVDATGSIDDLTIVAKAVVIPEGVEAEAITDDPAVDGDEIVIDADAFVDLTDKGVSATVSADDVIVIAPADVVPLGVVGTFTVGDETVNTVRFDYEAVKENYSRLRTAYIKEITDNTTRTASVNEEPNNIVYVKEQTSAARTAYVPEATSRTVYIEAQPSNYRTVFAQAA